MVDLIVAESIKLKYRCVLVPERPLSDSNRARTRQSLIPEAYDVFKQISLLQTKQLSALNYFVKMRIIIFWKSRLK